MNDYLALTKPRITWLILMSTGVGYFFGLPAGIHGQIEWLKLFHTILGTGLIASGTAALNQWYERDADRKMKRTEKRPLPAGKLSAPRAMWFGITLAVAGFTELWLGVNLLTALLGAFTLGSYLFLYTPLKQRSALATVIGALPGAMPPMIGFAAAAGDLSAPAWALFAILFLWQFPHFLAISWMYREDYARAGILMLPVVDPEGHSTSRQMVIYASTLIPASLFPCLLGMTGKIYLVGALLLGCWFLYSGVRVFFDETRVRARQVLLVSVIYLPLIYSLMVLDRPRLMARLCIIIPLLFLTACARSPKPLPILGQVAPFHLTSQSGQDFDSATLSGHIWVADFIFTNCEGPCPRMSAYMRALQKATSDLPDLKMVSFTVDPQRDTPKILHAYGNNYNADPNRWYFLTGDPQILNSLDRDSFKLGNLGAAMDHSTRFVLVDGKGQIRGYYGIAAGDPVPQLASDAKALWRGL